MPERSSSLSLLPIIPEKGDPSLALYEHSKNSGIPIKNKYGSQLESAKQYQSQSAILQLEPVLEAAYTRRLNILVPPLNAYPNISVVRTKKPCFILRPDCFCQYTTYAKIHILY